LSILYNYLAKDWGICDKTTPGKTSQWFTLEAEEGFMLSLESFYLF
jgi:hypothetical protein